MGRVYEKRWIISNNTVYSHARLASMPMLTPSHRPVIPLALLGALAVAQAVLAQSLPPPAASPARVGPSFDCAAVHTPAAQLICSSPDLSRIDLMFTQTYYALRQQVGEAGWQALKVEAVDFENRTLQRCGVPATGLLPPDPGPWVACLSAAYERQRGVWLSRLSGPALEEAQRPIDQHVALQRDLQSLGFLPPTATIDGAYGAATRSAILAWQGAHGLPATGLLGNQDSATLEEQVLTSTTPSTGAIPPDIDRLINQWGELSDQCRGSITPDDNATKISCDELNKLVLRLDLRGWCFGTSDQSEAEKRWRQCPTPAAHIALAVNALRQVQQELAASRIAAAQAYHSTASLRMGARNWLGCSGGTDNDCMNNTASAVAGSNDAAAQGQWNTLWIAEVFREMAEDSIGKDLPNTQAKVEALGGAFGSAPPASENDLVSVAQSASESMALLAEIQGGVLMRKMGNDTLDNMARIQVSFHGAFASITEPGRRAALVLLDAANLLDKAESEVDMATEPLGVPSGHVLINTPTRHQ